MVATTFDQLPLAVRSFRPKCPGCNPNAAGARPCSFYDCPGLPTELRVTCDLCMYDFVADSGQVKCDHTTCETALRLKANVSTYEAWLENLITGIAASPR